MELLVIRHSLAASGVPDALRPLTEEGRRRFRAEAEALAEMGLRLDVIHHSPLKRAAETAGILAEVVGGETVANDGLAAAPDRELLESFAHARLAAVGHFPWVGDLTSLLLSGSREAGHHYTFEPGAVAWLEGGPTWGGMALKAFFPPEHLSRR